MVRMPTSDNLSQTEIRSPGVRRAPRSAIPGALQNAGQTISREALKAKAEGDALDMARANADWNTRALTENSRYDLRTKPDYGKWEPEISANLPKHQNEAAKLIRDPAKRELFLLQSKGDITRMTLGVREKAQTLDTDKRTTEGLASIDQQLALAAAPGTDKVTAEKIHAQARTALDNMIISGALTPAQGITARQNYTKKFASMKATQDVENDPRKAATWLNGGGNSTSGVLLHFEGFRSTPYMDKGGKGGQENTGWRAGYGSDTTTLEDGTVVKIKPGMYVSRADAERDLNRRTGEFQAGIVRDVGPEHWANLPEAAKAGLTSVAYNYGSLPGSVVAAVKTGDVGQIAAAVKGLSGHNGGINAKRRGEEAEIIAGGAAFDGLAKPDYYQFIEPDDRLRLASAAEAEWARRENVTREASALDRYVMDNRIDDDISQIELTGQSTNLLPESVTSVLGDAQTAKWLEQRAMAADIFKESVGLDTMTGEQIDERLKALKPKAGDANFDQRRTVYEKVATQANDILALRKKDPSAAVATSPLVKKAMADFDPKDPASNRNLVNARVEAQRQVGIVERDIMPLSSEQADLGAKVAADEALTVDARIQGLYAMVSQAPTPVMQRSAFEQMERAGLPDKMEVVLEAYGRGDTGAARRMFGAASLKDDGKLLKDIAPDAFDDTLSAAMFGEGATGQAFYGLDYGDPAVAKIAQRDFELAQTAALIAMRSGKDETTAINQALKDIMGDVERIDSRFQTQSGVLGVVPPGTDTTAMMDGMEGQLPEVRKAIEALAKRGIDSLPAGADAEMRAIFQSTHENNIENLMDEGVFRAIGEGWGFYDPYSGAFVPDKDGNALTWTTQELIDMGLKAQKTTPKRETDPGAVGALPAPPSTGMFGAPQ